MGISTDAMLFYGIEIPEDCEALESAEDAYKKLVTLLYGTDLQVGIHCHPNYPIYYIYRHEYYTYRGVAAELTWQEMQAHEVRSVADIPLYATLCKQLGIPEVAPKWHLVSYSDY